MVLPVALPVALSGVLPVPWRVVLPVVLPAVLPAASNSAAFALSMLLSGFLFSTIESHSAARFFRAACSRRRNFFRFTLLHCCTSVRLLPVPSQRIPLTMLTAASSALAPIVLAGVAASDTACNCFQTLPSTEDRCPPASRGGVGSGSPPGSPSPDRCPPPRSRDHRITSIRAVACPAPSDAAALVQRLLGESPNAPLSLKNGRHGRTQQRKLPRRPSEHSECDVRRIAPCPFPQCGEVCRRGSFLSLQRRQGRPRPVLSRLL